MEFIAVFLVFLLLRAYFIISANKKRGARKNRPEKNSSGPVPCSPVDYSRVKRAGYFISVSFRRRGRNAPPFPRLNIPDIIRPEERVQNCLCIDAGHKIVGVIDVVSRPVTETFAERTSFETPYRVQHG